MTDYGSKTYWEKRYENQKDVTFDWLEDYDSIKPILEKIKINKNSRILNVGCGNSELSERMYDDNYTKIYNIDICKNVIEIMRKRSKGRFMHFDQMDVRNLKYKDETFDLVIDKSTMDALLCGENSYANVAQMTKEISRVLKIGGYYLVISYGKPEYRVLHLKREHLDFDVQVFSIKRDDTSEDVDCGDNKEAKKIVHYVYICCKKNGAKNKSVNFKNVYDTLVKEEIDERNEEKNEETQDVQNSSDNKNVSKENDKKDNITINIHNDENDGDKHKEDKISIVINNK